MSVIIHIGVGKTATTTLQEDLFSEHPAFHYIGRPWIDKEWSLLMNSLYFSDDFEYRENVLRQSIETELGVANRANKKCLVISDETIATAPMASLIAHRLNCLLPNARILLTIRSQYTLAPSYYANHGRILKNVPGRWNGREVSFEEWVDWSYSNLASGFFFVNDYHRLAEVYSGVFGKSNISIILYEDLVNNPLLFADDLAQFLEIDASEVRKALAGPPVNPRASQRRVWYQLLRSRLFPGISLTKLLPGGSSFRRSFNRLLDNGRAFKRDLTPTERQRMQMVIGESNMRLMTEYGVDLSRYDYPLAPS